jgi:hypothetical protein
MIDPKASASTLKPIPMTQGIPATNIGDTIYNSQDGKLYTWTGCYVRTSPDIPARKRLPLWVRLKAIWSLL